MSLGCEFAAKQASILDGLSFDAVTFGEDGGAAAEVDAGGCQVVDALMVAAIVARTVGYNPFSALSSFTKTGRDQAYY